MSKLPWPLGWSHHFEASHSVNADHTYTLTIDQRPLGVECASQRFEVRKGEVAAPDSASTRPDRVARARSEMAQHGELQGEGDTYWYAWSFFVPEGFPDSVTPIERAWRYVTLTQFMQGVNAEGKWKPSFVFAKAQSPEGLILRHFPDDYPKYMQAWPIVPEKQFAGRWHDLVVHIKWTTSPTGFVQVWVDGATAPVLDAKELRTLSEGSGPVYHKYGVYRIDDPSLAPAVVYFSQVRRGKIRADVDHLTAPTVP